MNTRLVCFSLAFLAVMLALPVQNYQWITSPENIFVNVVSMDLATFAVVNGDDGWAHFEDGVLIIDFNGETIETKETRVFGSENDPIFQIKNLYSEDMNINLTVASTNVPKKTTVTIFVKPEGQKEKSFKIKDNTGEGVLGAFSLPSLKDANVWIKIQTNKASPADVTINLKLESSIGKSLVAEIVETTVYFGIRE